MQGYAGHYCSVPKRRAPNLVGCSMILSGLRVFDIRDVRNPKEVGLLQPAAPARRPPDQPRGHGCLRDVAARMGRRAQVALVHGREHRVLRGEADATASAGCSTDAAGLARSGLRTRISSSCPCSRLASTPGACPGRPRRPTRAPGR